MKLVKNIDNTIAALAGCFIIFLFTRHSGIGICPDGVAYISTAENYLSLGKCVDFTHHSLVDFPLLYPMTLATFSKLTGFRILSFIPVLNALLFGLLIFITGNIIDNSLRSRWMKTALLICIVCSPCLTEVYSMVWSETIFLLLLLLFIIAIRKYLFSHSLQFLIAAALLAGVASVTRYAGVTIIATGGILLLTDRAVAIRKKIFHMCIYASLSTFLLAINLWRNFSQSATLTGLREHSTHSFINVAADAGSVLHGWIFLPVTENTNTAGIAFILIAIFATCFFYQLFYKKKMSSYQDIAVIFSLIFILFMLVSASFSRFETMNSRLLSPLFIPLLLCSASFIIFMYNNLQFNNKKWAVAVAVVLFASFQYGQLNADYETWDGVKDAGIPGYTEDQWQHSRTVNYIKKDSLPFRNNYTIYSNAYDAIHFFTGRDGKFLPHKEFTNDVQQFLKDQHCYMVWFTDGDNPDLVDMDFITKVKKMKLLKEFDDGAIYMYDN